MYTITFSQDHMMIVASILYIIYLIYALRIQVLEITPKKASNNYVIMVVISAAFIIIFIISVVLRIINLN